MMPEQKTFDFSKRRIQEEDLGLPTQDKEEIVSFPPQEEGEASVQQPSPFDFSKRKVQDDPSKLREAGRFATRLGYRVAENIVGIPGSIAQMTKWVDSKLPKPPKFLDQEPSFLQKKTREAMERLPTPEDLKEMASEVTSGFTDPQGAMEEFGDDIVGLASALSMGKNPMKIKSIVGSLGKAVAAKGAGKVAESYGADEKLKFAAEMGTIFLMDIINPGMADKFVRDKYKKAADLIPEGTMLDTSGLTKELGALESDLSKGLSTATKNEVKSAVSELKSKVSGGAYPADEFVDMFHDINERMTSKKLFDELNPGAQKKLKFRYDKLKGNISSEIEKYGKSNPEFYSEWTEANEGFSAIQNSRSASRFIEKKIGSLPSHVATGMAIELFAGHPTIAAGVGASFGALKTVEMMHMVAKSPALRKHYLAVTEAAAKENFPAMANSLSKLDEGLKRSFVEEE